MHSLSRLRERAGVRASRSQDQLPTSSATSAVVTAPAPKRSAMASRARFSACAVGGRRREQAELRRVRRRPGSARTRPSGGWGAPARARAAPPPSRYSSWPSSVGFVQRRAPGHQREIRALQLQLHGPRAQARARAAGAPTRSAWACTRGASASTPVRSSSNVSSAPMLFASRSGITGRGSMAFACSHSSRPDGPSRRTSASGSLRARCRRRSRAPSSPGARALFGPTPHSREHGQGRQERRAAAGRHLDLAVRLGQVRRDLRDQLHLGDAGRRGQADLVRRCARAGAGRCPRARRTAPATRSRPGTPRRATAARPAASPRPGCRTRARWPPRRRRAAAARRPRRAPAQRARHRHRAAHAERPHLVRRRQHHAAAGVAADDHRPAAQGRVVALLDGRVERVHVHVDDRARARPRYSSVAPSPPPPAPRLLVFALALRLRFGRRRRPLGVAAAISVPPIVMAMSQAAADVLVDGAARRERRPSHWLHRVAGVRRADSSSTRSSGGSRAHARSSSIGVDAVADVAWASTPSRTRTGRTRP